MKTPLKDVDIVLFDLDGTLMDTTDIIIASWQQVYKTVTGREGDVSVILKTFGEILRDSLRNQFPEWDTEELVRIYKSYQQDRFAKEVSLFPGVKEMLARLEKEGYKLGLTTSRIKETTLRALDLLEIKQYFGCIITADDCTEHKPDPQPVFRTMEGLGETDISRAVMIGDTVNDMMCARNAGVRYVMVEWSSSVDRSKLTEDQQPDAWISCAEELPDILRRTE